MDYWRPMLDPNRHFREAPWQNKMVWLMRPEWAEPQLAPYADINPAFNVAGAFWAPAIDGQGPPSVTSLRSMNAEAPASREGYASAAPPLSSRR